MNYSDKQLYDECVRLSNALKLYRNQFIALLPEVNKRQLYKSHGMHSIFEFGAKLAGLSHDTVRKVLKLKNDLACKPTLNSLFDSGEIGWSKLAVVSKISTPQNEQLLASKLHTMSKSALEVLVKDADPGVGKTEREKFSVKIPPQILAKMRVAKLKLEKEADKIKRFEQFKQVNYEKIINEEIRPSVNEKMSRLIRTPQTPAGPTAPTLCSPTPDRSWAPR